MVGLLLLYAVPPVATVVGFAMGASAPALLGATAWLLMSASYLPMLHTYRLSAWWAPLLPVIALLYAGMTVDSAWRHVHGRGGAWKGRTAPDRV